MQSLDLIIVLYQDLLDNKVQIEVAQKVCALHLDCVCLKIDYGEIHSAPKLRQLVESLHVSGIMSYSLNAGRFFLPCVIRSHEYYPGPKGVRMFTLEYLLQHKLVDINEEGTDYLNKHIITMEEENLKTIELFITHGFDFNRLHDGVPIWYTRMKRMGDDYPYYCGVYYKPHKIEDRFTSECMEYYKKYENTILDLVEDINWSNDKHPHILTHFVSVIKYGIDDCNHSFNRLLLLFKEIVLRGGNMNIYSKPSSPFKPIISELIYILLSSSDYGKITYEVVILIKWMVENGAKIMIQCKEYEFGTFILTAEDLHNKHQPFIFYLKNLYLLQQSGDYDNLQAYIGKYRNDKKVYEKKRMYNWQETPQF